MIKKDVQPPFLLAFVLSLAVLACFILLYLAQFAQFGSPPVQLRLEVIFFLGLLFASFSLPFLPSNPVAAIPALITAALLSVILSRITVPSPTTALPLHGSLSYLLSPVIALSWAWLARAYLKKNAELGIAISTYVVCTVLANYTLDSFIPLPLQIPAINFTGQVNVGTLFFGLIFTQRDRIHLFGRNYAYLAIALAAGANVLAAWYLATPWRFIAVSFLALSLSEVADTQVYQRFIKNRWWVRVATSNSLSIPIDSTVFTVLAFWGEAFATPRWMLEVILTDILVKTIVGLLSAIRIWRSRQTRLAQDLSSG
jgi:queuosine precursor transporter